MNLSLMYSPSVSKCLYDLERCHKTNRCLGAYPPLKRWFALSVFCFLKLLFFADLWLGVFHRMLSAWFKNDFQRYIFCCLMVSHPISSTPVSQHC